MANNISESKAWRWVRPQVWASRIIAHLQTRAEAARGHSRAHCVAHNMKARTQACFHTKHCCLTLFFSMTRAESRLQKPSDEWVVFHSFTHSFNTLYFWCRASVTWPNVPRPTLWESIRVRWNCALQVLECSCIHHPAMYAKHHLWESWEIGACDHIKSCNLCSVTSDKKLQLLKIYNQKKKWYWLKKTGGERRRQSCERRMRLGLLLFWACRPHLAAKLSSGLQCSIQCDRPLPSACSSRHNIRKVFGVWGKKPQNKTKWMPGQENWLLCFFATLVMQESCQPPFFFKFSV